MVAWFKDKHEDILPVTQKELEWAAEAARHNAKWEVYLAAQTKDLEIRRLRAAGAEPDSLQYPSGTGTGPNPDARNG